MYRLATFGLVLTAGALLCWPAPILAGPTVPYKDHVSRRLIESAESAR